MLLRLATTSIFLCVAFACTGPTPDEPEKPVVALVMKSLANEFFVRMADGARIHQQENADRYELVVNGTKDESDLAQQVALVEQMIATGTEALVIAPADSKALIPIVKRAIQAGLIVINIDNRLDGEILAKEDVQVPFVGPDNRAGARLVGHHLAQTLSAGDQVAIISGIATAYNAQEREAGFKEAMSAANVEIVSVQNGDWDQSKASKITAALVLEHPQLKAILCANDNMAIGAVAALRQAGKSGDIKVVGFDNIEAVHPLLNEGSILATADQFAADLAVFGIEYALEILRGDERPADKQTPVQLITQQDIQ